MGLWTEGDRSNVTYLPCWLLRLGKSSVCRKKFPLPWSYWILLMQVWRFYLPVFRSINPSNKYEGREFVGWWACLGLRMWLYCEPERVTGFRLLGTRLFSIEPTHAVGLAIDEQMQVVKIGFLQWLVWQVVYPLQQVVIHCSRSVAAKQLKSVN